MSSRGQERAIGRKYAWTTWETFNGPASYTVGGDAFTSVVMKQIERAVEVSFSRQGLRVNIVTGSVTGNRFRAQFYRNTGVDAVGRFTGEVASTTDLSADAFTVLLEGK